MDCYLAESMVNRYINRTLSLEDLELFLDHIENCTSCYDELETYYIVHAAIKQLDLSGPDEVTDFQNLLKQELKKTKRMVRKKKILRIISAVCIWTLVALVIGILIVLCYQVVQNIL